MSDVTVILERASTGDSAAAEQLLPLVYDELRKLAAAKMARESPGQTLQPTALVHEAWLRLGGDQQQGWQSRAHFFAAAAEAMRRILVDRARRKATVKHGANVVSDELTDDLVALQAPANEILDVNEALAGLANQDALAAEVVKLRYFAGFTVGEIAEVMNISTSSVDRNWAYARAWLKTALLRSQK